MELSHNKTSRNNSTSTARLRQLRCPRSLVFWFSKRLGPPPEHTPVSGIATPRGCISGHSFRTGVPLPGAPQHCQWRLPPAGPQLVQGRGGYLHKALFFCSLLVPVFNLSGRLSGSFLAARYIIIVKSSLFVCLDAEWTSMWINSLDFLHLPSLLCGVGHSCWNDHLVSASDSQVGRPIARARAIRLWYDVLGFLASCQNLPR